MNLKGCFYEKKVIMGGKIQEGLGRMDPAAKRPPAEAGSLTRV